MKIIIKFNIWDYVDVEDINQLVDNLADKMLKRIKVNGKVGFDKKIKTEGLNINIVYNCKKIDKKGNVVVETTYDKF